MSREIYFFKYGLVTVACFLTHNFIYSWPKATQSDLKATTHDADIDYHQSDTYSSGFCGCSRLWYGAEHTKAAQSKHKGWMVVLNIRPPLSISSQLLNKIKNWKTGRLNWLSWTVHVIPCGWINLTFLIRFYDTFGSSLNRVWSAFRSIKKCHRHILFLSEHIS